MSRLRELGYQVEMHDDHFSSTTEDVEWLGFCGTRSWVILTKDGRLRYRRLEKERLLESGCRVFILTAGNIRTDDIARIFEDLMTDIERIVRASSGPFVRRISAGGKIQPAMKLSVDESSG